MLNPKVIFFYFLLILTGIVLVPLLRFNTNLLSNTFHIIWLNLSQIANIALITGTLIAFVGVIVAYREYKHHKLISDKEDQPYIFIELDTSIHHMCNFVLRNIGKKPAKDIEISFSPNIEIYTNKYINDLGIFQHLSFLSPGRDISFYAGSFLENNIRQKLKISIHYKDIQEKEYYIKQILDPSEYLDLPFINIRGLDEIAESLEGIKADIKTISDTNKDLLKSWKNGLLIRNSSLEKSSLEEKLNLLAQIIISGNEEDLWLNPFVFDLLYLLKAIRDDVMSKKEHTTIEESVIKETNNALKAFMKPSTNNEFRQSLKNLSTLISKREEIPKIEV